MGGMDVVGPPSTERAATASIPARAFPIAIAGRFRGLPMVVATCFARLKQGRAVP